MYNENGNGWQHAMPNEDLMSVIDHRFVDNMTLSGGDEISEKILLQDEREVGYNLVSDHAECTRNDDLIYHNIEVGCSQDSGKAEAKLFTCVNC